MSQAKTYAGGCHCGAVRFHATADISTVLECNCSHCSAKGVLLAFTPQDAFVLEQGADVLNEYRFNTRRIAHQFCRLCGVEPFARAIAPDGQPTVALNVRTFDGIEESKLNRRPFDGAKL
jgi:hypothetical protein